MPESHLNDDLTVRLDPADDQYLTAAAIAACTLCDRDGYHGSTVCDHIDRRDTARRGMDALRAQMGWNQPATPDGP